MFKAVKKWFKSTDTFEMSAIIFIFLGIAVIAFAFIAANWNNISFIGRAGHILDYSEFVGGLIGSFWSLAGVLLFYASLTSQKADLEAQKDLLVKQIDEIVAQTKESRIQNELNKKQKNEDTFFQLLRFHNEIISAITLDVNEMDFSSGQNIAKTISGRKTFVEYYDTYKRFFQEASEMMPANSPEGLAKLFDKSYSTFYLEYQSELGHYFRNLFNIIKYVTNLEAEDQPFFFRLLYAQLSNFELIMLFFHCLKSSETEYKELVEKNALLDAVPKDEVTSMAFVLYDKMAFGESGFGSGDNVEGEEELIFDDTDIDLSGVEKASSSSGFGSFDDILGRLKKVDYSESEDTEDIKEDFVIEDHDGEGGLGLSSFFDEDDSQNEEKNAKPVIDQPDVDGEEDEELSFDNFFDDEDESESEKEEIKELIGKELEEEVEEEELVFDDFFDSEEEPPENKNENQEIKTLSSTIEDEGKKIEELEIDLSSLKDKMENFAEAEERKSIKDEFEKKMQTDDDYEKIKQQLSGLSEENILGEQTEEETKDFDEEINVESSLDTKENENITEVSKEKPAKRRLRVKPRGDDKKGKPPEGKGFLSKM
jgi:Putative phage abortive infection protein